MTTALDTRMAATVKRILDRFHTEDVQLKRVESNYDELADTAVESTTTYTQLSATPLVPYALKERANGLTIEGAMGRVYLASSGLTVEPDPQTDTLCMEAQDFKILEAISIYSGDDVAAFELHVGR